MNVARDVDVTIDVVSGGKVVCNKPGFAADLVEIPVQGVKISYST